MKIQPLFAHAKSVSFINTINNSVRYLSGFFLLGILSLFSYSIAAQDNVVAEFIVFSDPHYYDPSMGTEGSAFEEYLDNDRKLLIEAPRILDRAVSFIEGSEAGFVLVPGDLTKDGSLVSHQKFSEYLARIENSGKKVFVVPGNHDILNPESFSYRDSLKIEVENVSPVEFAGIYNDYGYGEAISRDSSSLSYVACPQEGIWILAMDACRYNENRKGGHPVTAGRFNPETLQWINERLVEARLAGIRVMGMMHHGVVEHYNKQSKFFGQYLVEDYSKISRMFAEQGMNLVFTGHYHAQDIVKKEYKNSSIYDIETGSLVTFPCPVRKVVLTEGNAIISSFFIDSISGFEGDFSGYARDFVWSGIEGIAHKTLLSYKLKEEEAGLLSGQVADAFLAHYAGDETEKEKPFNLEGVSLKGRFLISFKKKLVWNLWNDIDPGDNEVVIEF